jgi:hypothetical protein
MSSSLTIAGRGPGRDRARFNTCGAAERCYGMVICGFIRAAWVADGSLRRRQRALFSHVQTSCAGALARGFPHGEVFSIGTDGRGEQSSPGGSAPAGSSRPSSFPKVYGELQDLRRRVRI